MAGTALGSAVKNSEEIVSRCPSRYCWTLPLLKTELHALLQCFSALIVVGNNLRVGYGNGTEERVLTHLELLDSRLQVLLCCVADEVCPLLQGEGRGGGGGVRDH